MKLNFRLCLAILIFIGGVAWFLLRPNEEGKIRKRFQELRRTVDKSAVAEEQEGHAAVKLLTLNNLFTEQVEIRLPGLPENGILSNAELCSFIMNGRRVCTSIDIFVNGLEIEIDGDTATCRCSATATIQFHGETYKDRYEVQVGLVKQGRTWRFSSCTQDPLLQK